MEVDTSSKVLRQVLDTLILNSPFKTCMGSILGFAVDDFSNLVPQSEPISWYAWVCLFVFILNVNSLFKKENISERNKRLLALIAKGRRDGLISQQEARQRYRLIVEQEVNRLSPEEIQKKAQAD